MRGRVTTSCLRIASSASIRVVSFCLIVAFCLFSEYSKRNSMVSARMRLHSDHSQFTISKRALYFTIISQCMCFLCLRKFKFIAIIKLPAKMLRDACCFQVRKKVKLMNLNEVPSFVNLSRMLRRWYERRVNASIPKRSLVSALHVYISQFLLCMYS